MLVVGTFKPVFPINNFVKVIFEDDNKYYIQKYDSNTNSFFFEKINLKKKIIKVKDKVNYDKNIQEFIYGYLTEKNEFFFGTLNEIEKKLLKLLNNKKLPPMARYLISKQLGYNGKAKLLKIESAKYFAQKKLNVYLSPHNREFEMFVGNEDELIKKFKVTLDNYNIQITNNPKYINWSDVTDFDDDYKNVVINKFKINTNNLVNILNENLKYKKLLESIIDDTNTFIDFEFENKIDNIDLSDIEITNSDELVNQEHNISLENIVKFIENKNAQNE